MSESGPSSAKKDHREQILRRASTVDLVRELGIRIQKRVSKRREKSSVVPRGRLNRIEPVQQKSLKDSATIDLMNEVAVRFRAMSALPDDDQMIGIANILLDRLEDLTDVHWNQFSFRRIHDYYSAYLRPGGKTRPPLKDATWVEIGCGAKNPLSFLFLVVMLGAARGIAVDLDPIEDRSRAWKALADLAARMCTDPKSIVDSDDVDPRKILNNICTFDLPKLRSGSNEGIDHSKLMYLQESADHLSIADASADVVISNAFLEHIPDPGPVIREFSRITRPDGMGIHTIDGTDHRSYTTPGIQPLDFLKIESEEKIVAHCNRIRPLEFKTMFEQNGFQILELEILKSIDVTPEMRNSFQEPFRSMPSENLEAMMVQFVVQRKS